MDNGGFTTLVVRKLNVGDIILTSTFSKVRPLLILKITDNFAYGVPLSSKRNEYTFTSDGLNNCRFLKSSIKQWVHPTIHRVGADWGVKKWIGQVNPAAVIKIRNQVKEILNTQIL